MTLALKFHGESKTVERRDVRFDRPKQSHVPLLKYPSHNHTRMVFIRYDVHIRRTCCY